jgi:hypothetical protein
MLYSSVNCYSVNYQISTGTCLTYHETSVVGKEADGDLIRRGNCSSFCTTAYRRELEKTEMKGLRLFDGKKGKKGK